MLRLLTTSSVWLSVMTSMGIAGIFFGTIFSMAVTSLWVEPLVLFRHGLKRSMGEFWGKECIYLSFSGAMIALTHYADTWLVEDTLLLSGWLEILAKFQRHTKSRRDTDVSGGTAL